MRSGNHFSWSVGCDATATTFTLNCRNMGNTWFVLLKVLHTIVRKRSQLSAPSLTVKTASQPVLVAYLFQHHIFGSLKLQHASVLPDIWWRCNRSPGYLSKLTLGWRFVADVQYQACHSAMVRAPVLVRQGVRTIQSLQALLM